jgi:signal peptidase I
VAVLLLGILDRDLIRLFSINTRGMAPEVAMGDGVLMEGFTYLFRKPRRGDVVIFHTGKIEIFVGTDETYIDRVAGVPGDELRIVNGQLMVNGVATPLRNSSGELHYEDFLPMYGLSQPMGSVTVPEGNYFVLRDNTAGPSDSRWWGCVPASEIRGRAWMRYRPANRVGWVR